MKKYEYLDAVELKKKVANSLKVYPYVSVLEDSGDFLTVLATDLDNSETRKIMVERESLLKKYQ